MMIDLKIDIKLRTQTIFSINNFSLDLFCGWVHFSHRRGWYDIFMSPSYFRLHEIRTKGFLNNSRVHKVMIGEIWWWYSWRKIFYFWEMCMCRLRFCKIEDFFLFYISLWHLLIAFIVFIHKSHGYFYPLSLSPPEKFYLRHVLSHVSDLPLMLSNHPFSVHLFPFLPSGQNPKFLQFLGRCPIEILRQFAEIWRLRRRPIIWGKGRWLAKKLRVYGNLGSYYHGGT